ncbi:type I restriction-modification system subunit M [Desulfobaculum bizertense]|uniref:type I restriction-modification system subunit M n=1 Tax=Desulfobaculum bizertense TaxID=376490 RepID=UPI001F300460|nr:class I SAM-dependent DNA methyltransferase [Desulfobaculum bizertense]UIJ38947.1 type I restriction-modification system subunit M [Desulfobaculum bizertense]
MNYSAHNKLISFIWSIADDCLRDVFVRGKYRDVILPMFVLRRLDCLLEPTNEAVLKEVKYQREEVGMTVLDSGALCEESGYVFYNTSRFTLKSLLGNPSQLEANFNNYLDGFSDNVKEIIQHFDLRNQAQKMATADVLFNVIEKFVSPEINLSPKPVRAPDGRSLPALTNLGMGYVFEELIRKFNEENNEEAGEHFTPREVIHLMTNILFKPVNGNLPPVLTIYDPACGSGGMLTESEKYITDPNGGIKTTADVYLYGKEVNGETYAICKSDMMIKGNDPENIKFGSTLATDDFSSMKFDFMLSNPPYGKSWSSDAKFIKDGKEIIDPRFMVRLEDYWGDENTEDATPASSDGQLLFLMEMVNKMKSLSSSPLGSRIACVHNGSSLFTGDAGGGASNIRRHVIENDWVEAIIQLPTNLFYNTGITTYIWILSNNKSEERKGKIQLINASEMYHTLRKNLGAKNCELSPDHVDQITKLYLSMDQNEISKVFKNSDFGYYKIVVDRPLRLAAQFTPERIASLRFMPAIREISELAYEKFGDDVYADLRQYKDRIESYLDKEEISITAKNKSALLSVTKWREQKTLMEVAQRLADAIGDVLFMDYNAFVKKINSTLKSLKIKLAAPQKKQILNAMSWRDENAEKVIKKVHKLKGDKLDQLLDRLRADEDDLPDYGYYPTDKKDNFIEYEADSELRDTEVVPIEEDVHEYFLREVRLHVEEAWIDLEKTKIGYQISFNKYFYKHTPLRSLEEVAADILQLESETDGLLKKLMSFEGAQ